VNNSMNLVLYGLLIQLFAIVALFLRDNKKSSAAAHFLLSAGLLVSFISTIVGWIPLFTGMAQINSTIFPNFLPREMLRFDSLGLYFLAIIQLVAIPTTIYSFSYLDQYIEKGKSVRSTTLFYITLLVSTQLLVLANHAVFFLVCWEIMCTSAYLGMIFEREKLEVQRGSFYYLVASHVAVFILYIFFFLLHAKTGSWFFTDFHLTPDSGSLFVFLYILSLLGFGIKAGFMPFHFWLPEAHPIAPTIFSSFLSGIIIKTGIYGLFRTFQFLNPVPEWLGWLMLSLGMVSAIFGVWYALAQHDIKRLLAYHSVENIGIIGIGLGLGFIGSAHNSIPVQVLGFGGALLHTLNHAIFKSLLFIGSGIIYKNLGTRNIELMGGLVHRSKYFVLLFLIGSVAISGIPPLNGFVSEFIIYNGFFETAKELKNYYPLMMLLSVAGLAFVGGLAVACFTKINSIMFLGAPRQIVKKFEVSFYEYLSLFILAFFCVLIGFYPQPFLVVVNHVLNNGFVPASSGENLISINWPYITISFSALFLLVLAIYFWKKGIQKKYGKRKDAAWGCGYEYLNPRMQYTASSFADELNTIPKTILTYHKNISSPQGIFPKGGSLSTHSDDLVNNRIVLPIFRKIVGAVSKIEFLSNPDIRYYIGFILGMITIYGMIGYLWF